MNVVSQAIVLFNYELRLSNTLIVVASELASWCSVLLLLDVQRGAGTGGGVAVSRLDFSPLCRTFREIKVLTVIYCSVYRSKTRDTLYKNFNFSISRPIMMNTHSLIITLLYITCNSKYK